jgi:hypothetical protein
VRKDGAPTAQTNVAFTPGQAIQVDGLSATISGGGMLYTASLSEWYTWFNGDDGKNIQFSVNVLLAAGGGYWEGSFKLTQFEVTSDGNKEQSTCNVTLVSDGAVTWNDAAA